MHTFRGHIFTQTSQISFRNKISTSVHLNCLALKLWSPLLKGKKVVINCDNQTSVRVLNRGFCRDKFLQSCLREICFHSAINEFQIRAHEISSCENRIPYYLSRWDLSPKFRSSFFQAVKGQHLVEYIVDESLFTFSHDR